MKGHNKQFNKYLDYELNDCYLEPLKDNETDNLDKYNKTLQKGSRNNKYIHSHQQHSAQASAKIAKSTPTPFKWHSQSIHDFIIELQKDELDRAEDLQQIQSMKNVLLFEQEKNFYEVFRQNRLLCLSIAPNNEISLWRSTYVSPAEPDSNSNVFKSGSQTNLYFTFLSIAKVEVPQNEKVLEAKFLDDNWFYIVAQRGPGYFAIRFYTIKSLLKTVIANASKYAFEILITNMYTYSNAKRGCFEATVQSNQKTIVARKGHENLHYPNIGKRDLPYITRSPSGVIFLTDTVNSNYIAWKGDSIVISDFLTKMPKSIYRIKSSVFFKSEQQGADCEFALEEFPVIKTRKEVIPPGAQNIIEELSRIRVIHQKVLNRMANQVHYSPDCSSMDCQYPLAEKGNQTILSQEIDNDGTKDKESKSIFEKINKIKKEYKEIKSTNGNAIEVQKEMLKEIRDDINSKIKELRQFKEEYNKEQKRWNPEEMIEPEGVSKEELELYERIKAEKKKLGKEREKKKTLKKCNRSETNMIS